MLKKEKYFEGGTKILEKSYEKSLFISKSLAKIVLLIISKVGSVYPKVVVSLLPHAEFERNGH